MNLPAQKIVVIGAGLSGLTTAYRLKQKGYDVEVYEARNRVGGRVHSVYIKNFSGEYSIGELGAQNITDGGDSHTLEKLAEELGLEIETYEMKWDPKLLYNGEFHYVNPIRRSFVKKHPDIIAKLHEVAKSCDNMQQVLDQLIDDECLKQHFAFVLNSYEGSHPQNLALTHNLETLESLLEGGISTAHQGDAKDPVFKMASIKGGNAKLAEKLSEKLEGCIHLNKVLQSVRKNDTQVELAFEDGSRVIADKLIFSIPASVFKDVKFADDIIPVTQLQKIMQVQYGTNGKIMVPADKDDTKESAIRIGDAITFFNNDGRLLNIYIINEGEKDNDYFDQIYPLIHKGFCFTKICKDRPVPAEEQNFSKYEYPVAKSWINDRFSRGAYSNFGIALDEEFVAYKDFKGVALKEIFYPVNEQIFFVGEHTSLIDAIGTMEAAVESGERLAKSF